MENKLHAEFSAMDYTLNIVSKCRFFFIFKHSALTSLLPIPFVRYYTVDAMERLHLRLDRALAATVFR